MRLLAKLRADRRVDEICVEQPLGQHREGYFVYLKDGWRLGDAHCFGEDTVRDIQRTLRMVEPCDCKECRGE